jgi:hypothetical protein
MGFGVFGSDTLFEGYLAILFRMANIQSSMTFSDPQSIIHGFSSPNWKQCDRCGVVVIANT